MQMNPTLKKKINQTNKFTIYYLLFPISKQLILKKYFTVKNIRLTVKIIIMPRRTKKTNCQPLRDYIIRYYGASSVSHLNDNQVIHWYDHLKEQERIFFDNLLIL